MFDAAAAGFGTISGALTISQLSTTTDSVHLRLQAACSFSGSDGNVGQLYVGEDVYMRLNARL